MALLVLAACAQLGPLSPGTATSALGPADAAKTGQGWFLHLRGEAELTGHIGFQIIHRNITVDGFEVSRKNITVEVNPGDKLAMIGPRLVNKLRLWGIDVTCSAIKEDRFIIGISHADQPPQELLGGVVGLALGTNGPILSFQELERCELDGRNNGQSQLIPP